MSAPWLVPGLLIAFLLGIGFMMRRRGTVPPFAVLVDTAAYRPPFVLDNHGDLQTYSSLEQVLLDLEAIDVNNNEYRLYDGTGRELQLGVRREGLREDQIVVADVPPKADKELYQHLLRHLAEVKLMHEPDLPQRELIELLSKFQNRYRLISLPWPGLPSR